MEIKHTNFFNNTGGLNFTDSPFAIDSKMAVGGANFEYSQSGAIKKRNGHYKLNSTPASNLKALGLGLRVDPSNIKTVYRGAGLNLENVDTTTYASTVLTEDTLAAGSSVIPADSTIPLSFSQFNTASLGLLNVAGNLDGIYSIYSDTKYTKNGAAVATGSITATPAVGSAGVWAATGLYFYTVVLRKASTQALSNAALDTSATVSNTTDTVTVDLTGLTGLDTTKYDQIWIYRSAVSGASGFTTGNIIAKLASTATSYADTGTVLLSSENVPRADSTVLDNSALGAGTYDVVTTWKRRLVTATGATVRFTETNKPESWPTVNSITLPIGGKIKAFGVIAFNTEFGNDEYLAVFQERLLWIIKGTSISDITLSYVDSVGCATQSLLVSANGFLFWPDYRGFYMWNGSDKPVYISRNIETIFSSGGVLDKAYLNSGVGAFFRKKNEIIWFLSHKTYGVQKFALRLDLRLTLPALGTTLDGRILDAVFVQDTTPFAVYSAVSYLPADNNEEVLLIGDSAGYTYSGFVSANDGSTAVDFSYVTPWIAFEDPSVTKRFHKVVVWVEQFGMANLSLDYWTSYRPADEQKSTISERISRGSVSSDTLWDVALWDVAKWDEYTPRMASLTYHLRSDTQNNSDGTSLRLRFTNNETDAPVTILGYTIYWSPSAVGI